MGASWNGNGEAGSMQGVEERENRKCVVRRWEREDWTWTRGSVSGHVVEEEVLLFEPGLEAR